MTEDEARKRIRLALLTGPMKFSQVVKKCGGSSAGELSVLRKTFERMWIEEGMIEAIGIQGKPNVRDIYLYTFQLKSK